MPNYSDDNIFLRARRFLTGKARDPRDKTVYHQVTMAAFLAWVGLGSDGLSSSCYGPPEAFAALHQYPGLGVYVALATALTIFVISASYSQIIEVFPSGGGGYLVASKLLSPWLGAVSGCALLVDYVLTITISVASGSDALFSFLPDGWLPWKLTFSLGVILLLMILNLRGVRESVAPLVPLFLIFVLTHLFLVIYAPLSHPEALGGVAQAVGHDTSQALGTLGLWGLIVLIMHSYSLGAGTYTGIEAVSNGMPMLREPRVKTAKRTMTYMWVSLAVMAAGIMLSYLVYNVSPVPGKTLNAIALEAATKNWPYWLGYGFLIVTLLSEALILCMAAQTGFLSGPRVLSNMALDRWMPGRLCMLSDRLVTHNGIFIMGGAALLTMLLTRGAVSFLVVLYSINVFITFALTQAGMVKHWWQLRNKHAGWKKKIMINSLGLALTIFILVWITVAKFFDGGWMTLLITSALVLLVTLIRRHYSSILARVNQFDRLARALTMNATNRKKPEELAAIPCDPKARTAVILVQGFNGMGIHTVLNVVRYFGGTFKNFVFISTGIIDAGNFKGIDEVGHLENHVKAEAAKYEAYMRSEGYYAECMTSVGTDIADEIAKLAEEVTTKHPNAVFFAGQLVFANETPVTRILHNSIAFSVQKRLYRQGLPFVIMPFRV